jgi:hydroxymethylglutaryl-CoA reductase (NADPH)
LEYLIESNFSGDKNSSFRALFKGRGHSVICESIIERKLIDKILGKDSAEKLLKSTFVGSTSSSLSGIPTFNLHTVNALCAIYIACGQDVACAVENSLNTFYAEVTSAGDFKFSINMPSITVGTVGGGTLLEDQKKNLEILGCQGPDSSKKLAEIIGAACLCIEMSLGLAVADHEFVKAHQKYSRRMT